MSHEITLCTFNISSAHYFTRLIRCTSICQFPLIGFGKDNIMVTNMRCDTKTNKNIVHVGHIDGSMIFLEWNKKITSKTFWFKFSAAEIGRLKNVIKKKDHAQFAVKCIVPPEIEESKIIEYIMESYDYTACLVFYVGNNSNSLMMQRTDPKSYIIKMPTKNVSTVAVPVKEFRDSISKIKCQNRENVKLILFPLENKLGIKIYAAGNNIQGQFGECFPENWQTIVQDVLQGTTNHPVFIIPPDVIQYFGTFAIHDEGHVYINFQNGKDLEVRHTFGCWGNHLFYI